MPAPLSPSSDFNGTPSISTPHVLWVALAYFLSRFSSFRAASIAARSVTLHPETAISSPDHSGPPPAASQQPPKCKDPRHACCTCRQRHPGTARILGSLGQRMLTGREVIDHPLNRHVETFRRQHQSPKAEDQNPQPRRDGQAKSQKHRANIHIDPKAKEMFFTPRQDQPSAGINASAFKTLPFTG
jgi:hypothetical protein